MQVNRLFVVLICTVSEIYKLFPMLLFSLLRCPLLFNTWYFCTTHSKVAKSPFLSFSLYCCSLSSSLGCMQKRLRWSRGSVLAFGTQVRGLKPGRSRRFFFQGEKLLSPPSFGKEVKPFVPCRIFAACKSTRKCMLVSRSFRSKLPAISRPSSSSFHY